MNVSIQPAYILPMCMISCDLPDVETDSGGVFREAVTGRIASSRSHSPADNVSTTYHRINP